MTSHIKYFYFIILILIGNYCFAQKQSLDSLLIGSWQTINEKDGIKYSQEMISFYPNGKYQTTSIWYPGGRAVDTIKPYISYGDWKLENKIIRFYNEFSANEDGKHYYSRDSYKKSVLTFNDSTLKIKIKNTNVKTPKNYICSYKKIQVESQTQIISSPFFSDQSFCLINSLTGKKVKLKVGIIPTYYLQVDTINFDKKISYHSIVASLNLGNDSVLDLIVIRKNEYLIDNNGNYQGVNQEYAVENRNQTIEVKNVIAFKHQSKFRGFCDVTGSFITPLSIFTSLIAAPLASINYKTGGFNSKRYYTIAGSGLIGLSLGLTLNLAGKEKYYSITSKTGGKSKELWYFDHYSDF